MIPANARWCRSGVYRREGYDPSQVSDPLYFLDGDRYIPIDDELYGRIQASRAGPR
jgi:hypothetical protein